MGGGGLTGYVGGGLDCVAGLPLAAGLTPVILAFWHPEKINAQANSALSVKRDIPYLPVRPKESPIHKGTSRGVPADG